MPGLGGIPPMELGGIMPGCGGPMPGWGGPPMGGIMPGCPMELGGIMPGCGGPPLAGCCGGMPG